MMKKFLFTFLLFYPFVFFGQNTNLDSIPVIDSLSENNSSDTLELTTAAEESLFDFFSKKELLELTLTADFDTLLRHKKKLVETIPAKVSFSIGENEKQTLKASIKPRGKFRRKNCDFPPLRLKFKKKGLRKLGLNDSFNSFKLVTHCLENEKKSKDNIVKEYLLYKIYQLHSEHSLRAQLVKITYVQKGSKEKLFTRYGILLEEDKELAYRSNAALVEKFNISPDSLNRFESGVHAVFQCMIGNSDWDLLGMRNVKIMRLENQKKLTVFPYDFDFSGFVNASYAIANPNYNLNSTRQRVFLGQVHSDEEMKKVARYFLEKKEATLDLCKSYTLLSKKSRKDIVKYLNSFYKMMKNEKKFIKRLNKFCPKK